MRNPSIEFHPDRLKIEADIVSGMPVRAVAAKWKLSKSGVGRHKDKMPGFVQEAIKRGNTPKPAIFRDMVEQGTCPMEDEGTEGDVPALGTDRGTKEEKTGGNLTLSRQEIAAHSGQSILDQVIGYNAEVRKIFDRTVEERPALALAAVREAVRLMELQGRLLGDLKSDTDVKIAIVLPEGLRRANVDG